MPSLSFSLPEEKDDFYHATKARDYYRALHEIKCYLDREADDFYGRVSEMSDVKARIKAIFSNHDIKYD